MDPETEKIIKEQMEKLSPEIRSLFTDSRLGDKILEIGRKNGITNVEKLGIFQTETNLLMLGLVHPNEYPNELQTRLKIDDMKTDNIVNDVNIQILRGMREKLRKAYEESDENEEIKNEPEIESAELSDIPDEKIENLENREDLLQKIEHPEILNQKELVAPPERLELVSDANASDKLFDSPENNKDEPHSISSQRLSESFKMPMIKNDHSSAYTTKSSEEEGKIELLNVDPYREIPE